VASVVRGVVPALAGGLTVAACGSAGNNGGALVRTGDLDAGSGQGGADASFDASSCHPGDVQAFVWSYRPAVPPQAACRPDAVQPGAFIAGDPIEIFYDDCFGPHKSALACSAFATASPAYAACAACIETSAAASSYGPLIVDAADGVVRANVGGCIELTAPLALSCAKAAQAQQGCEAAACAANCPVTDSASLDAYDECANQAAAGGCAGLTTAAGCVDAQAVSLASCLSTSFHDFYFAVVPLFCATSPADASAPSDAAAPPDSAAPDATSTVDAAGVADAGATDSGGSRGDGGNVKDATVD
jgi:hypothetical protein